MNQRGIRAGFLWSNRAQHRLAALYEATGWRFGSLEDHFYFRAVRMTVLVATAFFSSFHERDH